MKAKKKNKPWRNRKNADILNKDEKQALSEFQKELSQGFSTGVRMFVNQSIGMGKTAIVSKMLEDLKKDQKK